MRNLGTLYLFELRKIWKKKLTWITLAIMLPVLAVSVSGNVLGSYYVDGVKVDTHYNMMKTDRAYDRALNGRKVDQKLLSEMREAYAKIPAEADRYTITEEYQTYARPYSAVFNFVRQASGITREELYDWRVDEGQFYELRQKRLEENWDYWYLTEAEKTFWREKEKTLQTPFVFAYKDGWTRLIQCVYTVGILLLLLIGICLAGVFTDEHVRRTDQLILAGRLGKKELFWAKMLAGMSFAAACGLIFIVVTAGCTLLIYGMDGAGTALQFIVPDYSGALSVGDAALILAGLLLVASVTVSAFVMMLSELLHNNIGTLAVLFGIILIPMFVNIPAQYRSISRLLSWFPGELASVWSAFDVRPVKVFGIFLMSWQAVPIIYLLLLVAFCLIGRRAYQRYQVSGR